MTNFNIFRQEWQQHHDIFLNMKKRQATNDYDFDFAT